MIYPEFLATTQAREYAGNDYAKMIQNSLIEHIEKGYSTFEETLTLNLGQLFIGNDGE